MDVAARRLNDGTIPADAGIHSRRDLAPDHGGPRPSPGWRFGILSLLLVLFAATPAHAAGVAGYWYGEGYQPLWHENAQWLMHLSPDGGYAIEFRQYRYCRLAQVQKELGTWRLDERFRTVTTRVDNRPTHFENDYRVGALSDNEFRITHIGTGQLYIEKRVGADFKFPPPTCATS